MQHKEIKMVEFLDGLPFEIPKRQEGLPRHLFYTWEGKRSVQIEVTTPNFAETLLCLQVHQQKKLIETLLEHLPTDGSSLTFVDGETKRQRTRIIRLAQTIENCIDLAILR